MVDLKAHCEKIIPYRMRAVSMLTVVLEQKIKLKGRVIPMKIFLGGDLELEGSANLFINPALEAGLIHARALLDFMGLRLHPSNYNKLKIRKKVQHPDDIVIESYHAGGKQLRRVTVREIVEAYSGTYENVEKTLATLISTTNKTLVHSTSVGLEDPSQLKVLKTGSEIVPRILVDFFYKKLQLPLPNYSIRSRPQSVLRGAEQKFRTPAGS